GALDSNLDFSDLAEDLRTFVPSALAFDFLAPPTVDGASSGGLSVGVARAGVRLDYPDAAYLVRATGDLPIGLVPAREGRALRISLDIDHDLELWTDCLEIDSQPCEDNPHFDRLAWLAVPFVPPIGTEIPLPDVRLGDYGALSVSLPELAWHPVQQTFWIGGDYLIER
ncbi:MAG: hypothetical protein KC561_19430, partial [Myxococcales bacterium]|nr:hypothetical protein [Myxococcales bacterium]